MAIVDKVVNSESIGEEGLTLLPGESLQLVVRWIQFIAVFVISNYLNEIVPVPPEKGLVLHVLRGQEWHIIII